MQRLGTYPGKRLAKKDELITLQYISAGQIYIQT